MFIPHETGALHNSRSVWSSCFYVLIDPDGPIFFAKQTFVVVSGPENQNSILKHDVTLLRFSLHVSQFFYYSLSELVGLLTYFLNAQKFR